MWRTIEECRNIGSVFLPRTCGGECIYWNDGTESSRLLTVSLACFLMMYHCIVTIEADLMFFAHVIPYQILQIDKLNNTNCVSPSFFFPKEMSIIQPPPRTQTSSVLKRCYVCGKLRHISAFAQSVMNYCYSICNECYSFHDRAPSCGIEELL